MIDLWKKHGLIDAGGILKRDKFHGVPIFRTDRLSGDHPANGADPFSYPSLKIPGLDIVQSFEHVIVAVNGMDGKEETQGLNLMFKHSILWVGGWDVFSGVIPIPPTSPLFPPKGGGLRQLSRVYT